MTWFALRVVAMATMLIDHIWWNFIDNPILLTWIWRIAFPCYAFLLAESFFFVFKDRARLLKYVSMLVLLAVFSEPCYDLLQFGPKVLTNFMESQSVMITLLLWFLWMSLTELLFPSNNEWKHKIWWKSVLVIICAYLLIGFCNYKMEANFNFVGPLLVVAFYWFIRLARNEHKTWNNWSWIKRFSFLVLIFIVYTIVYFWVRSWFWGFSAWLGLVSSYLPWVWWFFVSAFILSLSNWKLWYHSKWFKYLYTIFYPLHALIIWILITFF